MGKQNSKVNPEVLADLKNQTEFTEKEIKEWYKGFLLDYPLGYLTIKEFREIYDNFYPKGNGDAFALHTFRVFDHNNDGKIDFREFLTALSVTSRGCVDDKLKWVYGMYDTDGNGYISKDEMLVIVQAIFKMVEDISQTEHDDASVQKQVDKIYQKLDKNEDGRLSLDEFIEGAKTDPTLSHLLRGDLSL